MENISGCYYKLTFNIWKERKILRNWTPDARTRISSSFLCMLVAEWIRQCQVTTTAYLRVRGSHSAFYYQWKIYKDWIEAEAFILFQAGECKSFVLIVDWRIFFLKLVVVHYGHIQKTLYQGRLYRQELPHTLAAYVIRMQCCSQVARLVNHS